MRTISLMAAGSLIALAAATDKGSAQAAPETEIEEAVDENEEGETQVETLEPYSLETVTAENMGEVAKSIWDRIPGEKYADRAETANALIDALRGARNNARNKRVVRSMDEILADVIDKPLSDLQAVRFPLGGLRLSIPEIYNLINAKEKLPMKPLAEKFMNDNKLIVVASKKKSRGKATNYLRKEGYVAPETEVDEKETEQTGEPKAA